MYPRDVYACVVCCATLVLYNGLWLVAATQLSFVLAVGRGDGLLCIDAQAFISEITCGVVYLPCMQLFKASHQLLTAYLSML